MYQSQPFDHIREVGLTEIIDKDDQVDQNDFSASVELEVNIDDLPFSGEFLSLVLVTSETGSGAVLTPAGTLILFDADVNISAGDTDIIAAKWKSAIGWVEIAAADWISTASGAMVFKQIAIPFHQLASVYAAWFHEDATSFNSAAGDDEEMHLNLWLRRDS